MQPTEANPWSQFPQIGAMVPCIGNWHISKTIRRTRAGALWKSETASVSHVYPGRNM